VAEASATADAIVLGVRRFDSADVPRRSAMGNRMSRLVFRGMTGYEVRDTQTGLRGLVFAGGRRLARLEPQSTAHARKRGPADRVNLRVP
jgi:hypothetical protein